MDEHTPGLKRELPDSYLRTMPVGALYELADECDVEPADPEVCDACAAYLIAQEKENRLMDETNLGPREYPAPSWPLENQPQQPGESRANWKSRTFGLHYGAPPPRPWLFEPGDKVLCLIEQAPGGPMIVFGVVQQVRIPGPIRTNQTVQVQIDDNNFVPEELGLLWWDPDKLERIHA